MNENIQTPDTDIKSLLIEESSAWSNFSAVMLSLLVAFIGNWIFPFDEIGSFSLGLIFALAFTASIIQCFAFEKGKFPIVWTACALVSLFSIFYYAEIKGICSFLISFAMMRTAFASRALMDVSRITSFFIVAPFEALASGICIFEDANKLKFNKTRVKIFALVILIAVPATFVFIKLFAMASPQIKIIVDCLENIIFEGIFFSGRNVSITLLIFICVIPFVGSVAYKVTFKSMFDSPLESAFESDKYKAELENLTYKTSEWVVGIFCAVFLIQNFFDAQYIASGFALPSGVTYSEYANDGATAMGIALLFSFLFLIVLASVASKKTENSGRLRKIICFWIFQNFFLCFAACSRLIAYTANYDLTTQRVIGFLYFVMVLACLFGATFMLLKNAKLKWLSNFCFRAFFAELLIYSVLNINGIVADFNVNRHLSGKAKRFDEYYIYSLGVSALPALYKLKNAQNVESPTTLQDTILRCERIVNSKNKHWQLSSVQSLILGKK